MGMPQIPDGKNRPNMDEVIIDLLESIALEEMAISHILNAEGEKLQSVISSYKNNQTNICGLTKVTNNVNQTISNLIMKEWLLLSKFNNIKDYSFNINKSKKGCSCDYCNTKNTNYDCD